MFKDRRDIPAGHVSGHGLNLCLGPLQTLPEALQSVFPFSLADMYDPSGSQIKNDGYVLAFLAEIDLVDGQIADFLKVKRLIFWVLPSNE